MIPTCMFRLLSYNVNKDRVGLPDKLCRKGSLYLPPSALKVAFNLTKASNEWVHRVTMNITGQSRCSSSYIQHTMVIHYVFQHLLHCFCVNGAIEEAQYTRYDSSTVIPWLLSHMIWHYKPIHWIQLTTARCSYNIQVLCFSWSAPSETWQHHLP